MNVPQYGYQPYAVPREGVAITTQHSLLFSPYFATVKPKILVEAWRYRSRAGASGPVRRARISRAAVLLQPRRTGPPPQRYPGVGAVIAFISICLLIIVILQFVN
jgi:hypothetical protein